MIKKLFAAALVFSAMGAQAELTPLTVWDSNTQIQNQGLQGVLFNTSTAGTAFVALGAHPYVNGTSMPNDGVSTFYGLPGLNPAAPSGQTRANWSFDFAFNTGDCTGCTVVLRIDNPADAAAPFEFTIVNSQTDINAGGGTWLESWNLEMAHLSGFGFDPLQASTTNFELVIRSAAGGDVLSTGITVQVPEPASLALVGAALAGLALSRRRKA